MFQIGVAPRRVDVMTTIEAVAFEEAWPQRLKVELDGVPVPVIGRAALLRNKRATGRAKAPGDAEAREEDDSSGQG